MLFSEVLKVVLKEQGLNVKQGALKCSVSYQQFHQYSIGKNSPSFDKAVGMLEKLNWKVVPTKNFEDAED